MPRYTFKYCSYIITILKLIILFHVDFTNNPSAYESVAPYTEKNSDPQNATGALVRVTGLEPARGYH